MATYGTAGVATGPGLRYHGGSPQSTVHDAFAEPAHTAAETSFRLADPWTRLVARLVDMGAFIVPTVLFAGIGAFALAGSNPQEWARGAAIFAGAYALGFNAVQWYLLATGGATIGKRLLGLRIVDAEGKIAGFVRAVLLREGARAVMGGIPCAGVLVAAVDNLLVFQRTAQTLHDQAAGTFVVVQRGLGSGAGLNEVRGSGQRGLGLAGAWVLGPLALLCSGLQVFDVATAFDDLGNSTGRFMTLQHRAKRSEMPGNVDAIVTIQQSWRAANGTWLPVSSEEEALARMSGAAQRDWEGGDDWERLGWAPDHPKVRGAYWVEVQDDQLVVFGVADVDGDGNPARYRATDTEAARLETADDIY